MSETPSVFITTEQAAQFDHDPDSDMGITMSFPDLLGIAAAPPEIAPEGITQIRHLVTNRFGGQVPDVVFCHSGGTYFSDVAGKHRTTSYSQLTEHGYATGGRMRVIAAAEIAEAVPETRIITNSFNRFDPDEPTMASIVKGELVHRGVDPERIDMEVSSFSTITQLVEMVKLAVDNKWERVVAIANEFHFPRMTAMFEMLDTIIDDDAFQEILTQFKAQGTQVEFISSEQVLRLSSDRFARYIDRVEQSEAYQLTVASEAKGLEDLRAGRYKVALTPEKPRDQT